MNTSQLTHHAATRMQQRGISTQTISLLLEFGRRRHDHRRGVLIYFDNAARAKIFAKLGKAASQLRLNEYCVADAANEDIITVGHRWARLSKFA